MVEWGEYAAAWLVFLLSHMIPARPAIRGRLVARIGRGLYLAGYSIVSLVILAWLIVAAGRAPFLPLWDWAAWQAWVPNIAMPIALVLAALGLGIANPFSLGGAGGARFDPSRPGIVGLTRHPVLWALVVWAAAHIPPNGDLAHVLLFGAFAAMGLIGMRAMDARSRRGMGEARWREEWQAARGGPLLSQGALWRIVAGLATWPLLLALHPWVIGVPAWAG